MLLVQWHMEYLACKNILIDKGCVLHLYPIWIANLTNTNDDIDNAVIHPAPLKSRILF